MDFLLVTDNLILSVTRNEKMGDNRKAGNSLFPPILAICPCRPSGGDSRGDTRRKGNRSTPKAPETAKTGQAELGQTGINHTVLGKSAFVISILPGILAWLSGYLVCNSGIPYWHSGFMV